MVIYHAHINNGVCTAVSANPLPIDAPNVIQVQAFNDDLIGRAYLGDGQFGGKVEPPPAGPTTDERLQAIEDAVLQLMLMGGGVA